MWFEQGNITTVFVISGCKVRKIQNPKSILDFGYELKMLTHAAEIFTLTEYENKKKRMQKWNWRVNNNKKTTNTSKQIINSWYWINCMKCSVFKYLFMIILQFTHILKLPSAFTTITTSDVHLLWISSSSSPLILYWNNNAQNVW